MKKRLLSLLLCLCMILGLLPAMALPAAAAETMVYGYDANFLVSDPGLRLNLVQEVEIGETPVLPTAITLYTSADKQQKVTLTEAQAHFLQITDASGTVVDAIDNTKAGTYTVQVVLPEGYAYAESVPTPPDSMTVNVGNTVYKRMYASDSGIKPAPIPREAFASYGSYTVFHADKVWQPDANGGIRTKRMIAYKGVTHNQITIPIPNDAYYDITAEMVIHTVTGDPTVSVAYVLDTDTNWVFSTNSNWMHPSTPVSTTKLNERVEGNTNATTTVMFPRKSGEEGYNSAVGGRLLHKGGDIQFIAGIDEKGSNNIDTNEDNTYVTLKNVKLTRLTNTYSVTKDAGSTGSGTFTLDWADSDSQDKSTGVAFASGTIGRGDTATLTAVADAGSHFVGWYKGSTLVSSDNVFTFVAGASGADDSAFDYTAKFDTGADTVLPALLDASAHNQGTGFALNAQTGWTAGTGFVTSVTEDKPLTVRFTTPKDNMNVYFDAALSNMALDCYVDGEQYIYPTGQPDHSVEYTQNDWTLGTTIANNPRISADAFEFQRSVSIPVAKAGAHTVSLRFKKDALAICENSPTYIYGKISGLGVTDETVKLTRTADPNCPAKIFVNGADRTADFTDSGLAVPYNSFVKLVSTPAGGHLADGFTLSAGTLHYYKQAYYNTDYSIPVGNAPVKTHAEFAAKAAAGITVRSITATQRNDQINAAVLKSDSGESYVWTATGNAWDTVDGGGLISSKSDVANYSVSASLETDFTVPTGEYRRLSFDYNSVRAQLELTKDGSKIVSGMIEALSNYTDNGTYAKNLGAGQYHIKFLQEKATTALTLKNFTVEALAKSTVTYTAQALAPYGQNPDITATVNPWGAWSTNADIVAGNPVTFTLDTAKLGAGYQIKSVSVNNKPQTLSNNQFTYTPTAADIQDGLTVAAVYKSPKVGLYKDAGGRKIYANGYPILIDRDYTGYGVVQYLDVNTGAAMKAGDLNPGVSTAEYYEGAYSIYGGSDGGTVASARIKVAGVTNKGAVYIFGGCRNGTVTGDTTVDVSLKDTTDGNALIFGGCENGKVGGSVHYTASLDAVKYIALYGGGSSGSVTGNITMDVTAKNIAEGGYNGLYGGGVDCSVGGVTLTVNGGASAAAGAAFSEIYGGSKAGINTAAAASAGNINLTLSGSLTADSVMGSSFPAGSVTLNIGSDTVITGKLTGTAANVSGKLTVNMAATQCGGIETGTGSIASSAVNITGGYQGQVSIKSGLPAPTQNSVSLGCGIYRKSGTAEGYDVYTMTKLDDVTYDEKTQTLYLNGISTDIRVRSTVDGDRYNVSYTKNGSPVDQYYATDALKVIYGGARDVPVSSTNIRLGMTGYPVNNVTTYPTLTIYGGGETAAAAVLGNAELNVWGAPGQTVYGGGKEGAVQGSVTLTYLPVAGESVSTPSTVYAGCENANVGGSTNLIIAGIYNKSVPDTLYGSCKAGTVGGSINILFQSGDFANGNLTAVYALNPGTEVPGGGVTFHAESYTATPFYLPDGTVISSTNPGIDAAATTASAAGTGSVKTYTIQSMLTVGWNEDGAYLCANGIPILYKNQHLYLDKGTLGAADSADVEIEGAVENIQTYYLGSSTNAVPSGEMTFASAVGVNDGATVYLSGKGYAVNGDSVLNVLVSLCAPSANSQMVDVYTGYAVFGEQVLNLGTTESSALLSIGDLNASCFTEIAVNQPFTGTITNVPDKVTPAANFDTTVYQLTKTGTSYTCSTAEAAQVTTSSVTQSSYGSRITVSGNVLLGRNADGQACFWDDVDQDRSYTENVDKVLPCDYINNISQIKIAGDNSRFTILESYGAATIDQLAFNGNNQDFLQESGTVTDCFLVSAQNCRYTMDGANSTLSRCNYPGYNLLLDLKQGSFGSCIGSSGSSEAANNKYTVKLGSGCKLTASSHFSSSLAYADLSAYVPSIQDTSVTGKTVYKELDCAAADAGALTDKALCIPPTGYDFETYTAADSTQRVRLYKTSGTTPTVTDLGTLAYGTEGNSFNIENGQTVTPAELVDVNGTTCTIKSTVGLGSYVLAVKTGETVDRQVKFTVGPRTLNITPKAGISKYVSQPGFWGAENYTVAAADNKTPAVTVLPQDGKIILTYVGADTAGLHNFALTTQGSPDGLYKYVLTGSNQLQINALTQDFNASATVSDETLDAESSWYRGSVVLNAPTGYLIAAANSGAASKSIVCTPAQDGASTFTYYLKDITESSPTYGLFSLQKTTASLNVDLAAPTITATVSEPTETTATISVSADDYGTIYVLKKAASEAAPAAADIVARGTVLDYPEAKRGTTQTISLTGLTGVTNYVAYAVAKDKSGQLSAVVSRSFTTAAKTTVAAAAPTASAIYGTALADIPLVTTGAAVHPDGEPNTTVDGTWAWDEPNPAAIYPAVNGAAYTAKFTPASADYKPVTAEITITVTAKPITVTPDSGLTKTYGQSDPVFTYTLSGSLLSGDSISGALSRDNSATNAHVR